MKLKDILNEVDVGDLQLAQTAQNRDQRGERLPSSYLKGFWLLDQMTGKKLAGPFPDKDAALRFKANRPDKIPATAIAKPL